MGLGGGAAPSAAPTDTVLSTFKFEQAGEELRVIDSDGSVYKGYVQDSEPTQLTALTELNKDLLPRRSLRPVPAAAPTGTATGAASVPAYFFRVTGTNRSLNQTIVFTGTLRPTNNVVARESVNAPSLSNRVSLDSSRPSIVPLGSSRVSGTVLVGNRQPVEINAVPAKP